MRRLVRMPVHRRHLLTLTLRGPPLVLVDRRALFTSPPSSFPRSSKPPSQSPSDTPSDPPRPLSEIPSTPTDPATEQSAPPFLPVPSFSTAALSLSAPAPSSSDLPEDLHALRAHLLTSFLPANQPCAPAKNPRKNAVKIIRPGMSPLTPDAPLESVLAVITPLEGGDAYISDAVLRIAAGMDVEVLHFDLALGLGFDGASAPLANLGFTAPPVSSNPLLQRIHYLPQSEPDDIHEMDDEEPGPGAVGVFNVPVMSISRSPLASSPSSSLQIVDEWVNFFDKVVNYEPTDRGRIILLESATAMASTFETWWPSFLEAVRRRRGTKELVHPTTVVLSCAPSLLPVHNGRDEEISLSPRSMAQSLVAKLSGVDGRDEATLWWGGGEADEAARTRRDNRRMRALQYIEKGTSPLLPAFTSKPRPKSPGFGILGLISSPPRPEFSPVSQVITLLPETRDLAKESADRITRRQLLNAALIAKAVEKAGGILASPLESLAAVDDDEWGHLVATWSSAQQLGSIAVGQALSQLRGEREVVPSPLVIGWDFARLALRLENHDDERIARAIGAGVKRSTMPSESLEAADTTIADVKASIQGNQYERRLTFCIVDPAKLQATSFADVHLPEKTIDSIRSMVSLPLLYPQAFRGGILKDHSTSGALLFGPPGTGKTLLARALANESGARMLAIQPSDINNMYLGESEKAVKAVFSVARKLSPCILFIDEVDALFSSRQSSNGSGGLLAHNQILTEFMQEIDGLSSAIANQEHRIVVIGATNRPFDLDDAVLRRLPRRILVDLPGVDDRKAILEILLREEQLADDVNLAQLAKDTQGFSGSDLKNLCVCAALAAVKDMVKLPWKEAKTGTAVSPVEATGTNTAHGVVRIPAVGSRQIRPSLRPTAASAEPDGPVVFKCPGVPQLDKAVEPDQDALRLISADTELSQMSADEAGDPPGRVISDKHFRVALLEIRPSANEEGTLPELRKWAEQFGEGGSSKAKRKGFGKSFGFGEDVIQEFGKVSE